MKYYFITYRGTDNKGDIFVWNRVIKISPMEFIKRIESVDKYYINFVILNTCEISEEEYVKYESQF